MARKRSVIRLAKVPSPRPAVKLPPRRAAGAVPGGKARPHAPTRHVPKAPVERPVGKPPNPRRLKPVRDVRGGVLGDLFAMFPDLPRAPRPGIRKFRATPIVRRRR